MDEWKRNGQIPAFGNWDLANELPITQYFETARQAGLVRYSSSSGESDPYVRPDRDLYAVDFNKPLRNIPPSLKKGNRNNKERRCTQVMMMGNKEKDNGNGNGRKQGRVCDVTVTEHPRSINIRKQQQLRYIPDDAVPRSPPPRPRAKPVDEDLYKIPPELLRTTKRKKMLGFISKCLVPAACVS